MSRIPVGCACLVAAVLIVLAAPCGAAQDAAAFRPELSLQAPAPGNEGWFGNSIAIDQTHLIVGEPFGDAGATRRAGRAHVFSIEGDLVITLQSPSPRKDGNFGGEEYCNKLVTVGGGVWAVGETNAQGGGKIYLFNPDGSVRATLGPSSVLRGNREFGNSLAAAERRLLAGSYNAGAFLYDQSGSLVASLAGPNGAVQDGFGMAVSVAGDTLVVTQDHASVDGVRDAGMAHIYNLDGVLQRSVRAPGPSQPCLFGVSASANGDLLVIGAPAATVDGRARAGTAYLFTTGGELKKVLSAPVQTLSFGVSVSIDDSRIVVGASGTQVDGMNGAGEAFVYDREGNFLASLRQPKPAAGGNFGWSVASQGALIAVSAPGEEVDGRMAAGRVYVFRAP
jgi:hypothetical protein